MKSLENITKHNCTEHPTAWKRPISVMDLSESESLLYILDSAKLKYLECVLCGASLQIHAKI